MKVVSIEYPTSPEKCNKLNDSIDVFVTLENGNTYCVVVATIGWLCNYAVTGYAPSGAPFIIVKELEPQLIEKAISQYSEDDAYWLRVYSMSYGDDIPD